MCAQGVHTHRLAYRAWLAAAVGCVSLVGVEIGQVWTNKVLFIFSVLYSRCLGIKVPSSLSGRQKLGSELVRRPTG